MTNLCVFACDDSKHVYHRFSHTICGLASIINPFVFFAFNIFLSFFCLLSEMTKVGLDKQSYEVPNTRKPGQTGNKKE